MTESSTSPLPDDKQADIEKQMAELIKRGYKREDLWVNEDGRVLVDQDAGALEAHMKIFHPEKHED